MSHFENLIEKIYLLENLELECSADILMHLLRDTQSHCSSWKMDVIYRLKIVGVYWSDFMKFSWT